MTSQTIAIKSRPDSVRWFVTALVFTAWLSIGLFFYAPSPLFPLVMDTYQVDRATVGLLIGGPALFQALLTIPGTLLASRLGVERTFAIGLFFLAVGVLAPFVSGFYQLLVLRFTLGAAMAVLMPLAGSILFKFFPIKYMPLLTGLSFFCINAGNGLGLLTVLPLANAIGWKGALGVIGAPPCVVFVAWLLILRRIDTPAGNLPTMNLLRDALKLVSQRNTLLLALAATGPWASTNILVAWLPTYYLEARHESIDTASALLSLSLLLTIPVNVLGAILTTRIGLRRPFLFVAAWMMISGGLASFLLPTLAIAFVGFMVFFAGARFYIPALFSIPSELPGTSAQKIGLMWSMVFTLGNLSSAISPSLAGFMRSQSGTYVLGFFASALLSATLIVSAMLLPETGSRKTRNQVAGAG